MRLRRLSFAPLLLLSFLCLARVSCARDVDRQDSGPIAPGVELLTHRQVAGPWEVRAVRIQRGAEAIRLQAAVAHRRLPGVDTLSHIIEQYADAEDATVAAVNADFFVMAGNPRAGNVTGLTIIDGELLTTARGRPAFVLMADGTPRIGVFETTAGLAIAGKTLAIAGINSALPQEGACLFTSAWSPWEEPGAGVVLTAPGLPLAANGRWEAKVVRKLEAGQAAELSTGELAVRAAGAAAAELATLQVGAAVALEVRTEGLEGPVNMAVGGGPVLVQGKEVLHDPAGKDPRHPRTMVGFNEREILLATVDGRQRGWSVGMNLGELGRLMADLGCTEALNLDGGGSTTIWVRGKVHNRPSDGGQRRIANALLLRLRSDQGPLSRVLVRPEKIAAMSGARVPVDIWFTDDAYNPLEADPSGLQVAVTGDGVGASLADGVLTLTGPAQEAAVTLSHRDNPGARATVPVQLVDSCPALALTPPVSYLCPGETATFEVEGVAEDGSRIWLPTDVAAWSVAGAGARQTGEGQFSALEAGGTATVTARVGDAVAQATVHVARDVAVEGFETAEAARFTRYPDTDAIQGQLRYLTADSAEGARHCRMDYNLGEPTATRAAYVRLDRPVGAALKLSVMARGQGTPPAWLRAAVVDGNGTRHTVNLADKLDWGDEWRRLEARLPEGLKQPAKWESVYVVATSGIAGEGYLDLDDLRVMAVPEGE